LEKKEEKQLFLLAWCTLRYHNRCFVETLQEGMQHTSMIKDGACILFIDGTPELSIEEFVNHWYLHFSLARFKGSWLARRLGLGETLLISVTPSTSNI
jgi:hypothetical protein